MNAMLHAIGGLPRPWMLAFHPWRSLPSMDGGNFHRTLHGSRRDFYHQCHIPSIDGRDFMDGRIPPMACDSYITFSLATDRLVSYKFYGSAY